MSYMKRSPKYFEPKTSKDELQKSLSATRVRFVLFEICLQIFFFPPPFSISLSRFVVPVTPPATVDPMISRSLPRIRLSQREALPNRAIRMRLSILVISASVCVSKLASNRLIT